MIRRSTISTGVFRSGQTGQTVNLLAYAFEGSNPSTPNRFRNLPPLIDSQRTRPGNRLGGRRATTSVRCSSRATKRTRHRVGSHFARRIAIWKSAARDVVLFTEITAGVFASRGRLSQPVSLRKPPLRSRNVVL